MRIFPSYVLTSVLHIIRICLFPIFLSPRAHFSPASGFAPRYSHYASAASAYEVWSVWTPWRHSSPVPWEHPLAGLQIINSWKPLCVKLSSQSATVVVCKTAWELIFSITFTYKSNPVKCPIISFWTVNTRECVEHVVHIIS